MRLVARHSILCALVTLLLLHVVSVAQENPDNTGMDKRWSAEKAWQWYNNQHWPCGFNYVPSNAISYTEMWMDYAFDPNLIDEELTLAEKTGFNCLRVVLPYVVWEREPQVFKNRLETFVSICDKHNLRVMFTLFDDCVFGPIKDPVYGIQPDVVKGWYANGWTPSPGHSMVKDKAEWPKLERYVQDIISHFSRDSRVWVWDLYNEPTNGGLRDVSMPLVKQVFKWAQEVDPTQPITVGIWNNNQVLNDIIVANSDIITFHRYGTARDLEQIIEKLKSYGRPIICTEWLNRLRASKVETHLPIFVKYKVGCIHWGLVNGKTQTHLPWGHRPGDPEPEIWQHDLYHSDFTKYDPNEIALFTKYIKKMSKQTK